MKITRNNTVFSSCALKTIATKVYRLLHKELTDNQIKRIDWAHLDLQIEKHTADGLGSQASLYLSRSCTEYQFAYYCCALLRWRAKLKNIYRTKGVIDFDNFTEGKPLPLKSEPKPRPKKAPSKTEKYQKEYEQAKRRVDKLIKRLAGFKIEQQKLTAKKKRTFASLIDAQRNFTKAHRNYLEATEQTADLTPKQYTARMRAKRDAKKNAPRTR